MHACIFVMYLCNLYMYICMYVCMYICMYVYMYVYMYVCMHACMNRPTYVPFCKQHPTATLIYIQSPPS